MWSRRAFLTSSAALAACGTGAARDTRPAPAAAPTWSPSPRPLGADFHRGVNLAHLHRRGWGYGSERAAAQVARLAQNGVTHLALNPFATTRSLSSPTIEWGGDGSLTDADLEAQVAQAHAAGMQVLMKPHLWSWAFMGGSGNGDIQLDPAGWKQWFERYTDYVTHYAGHAQRCGCAALCVGLEYTSASRENPGAWAEVARACRSVFKGPLVYAANWYQEWELFQDWDAFDLMGIDAYFPLTGSTVEELTAAWRGHFSAIEKVARGKPVVFPEAGYRAVVGTTEKPWAPDSDTPDLDLQARAYEALFRAGAERPWFKGVYWWKWFTDLPGEDDPFVPADKPAEAVMKAWFTA